MIGNAYREEKGNVMGLLTEENALARGDAEAAQANRNAFRNLGLATVTFISTPRAGKTSILEQTLPVLRNDFNVVVIEGDLYTTFDAERIRATGVPVWQIIPRTGRLVDAGMIAQALGQFPITGRELLVIERVGDLVSPYGFDLGEDSRVLVYSVTDGAETPRKHPTLFKAANAVLLSKTDLLCRCGVSLEQLTDEIRAVNPRATVLPISCRTGEGVPEWTQWLREHVRSLRKRATRAAAFTAAN
jgi:hydrogenase nickel incorporation protein HypB